MNEPRRVSTLELFFDLVFVFAITQLTSVLHHDGLGKGVLHGVLILGPLMWMYGGYAWLTNAVEMTTFRRQALLLLGMAAYLVLALAIPHAFEEDGDVFGAAYLVITIIHAGLFQLTQSEGSRQGMVRIGASNVGGALVILAGGIAGGDAQLVLWTIAFLWLWVTPLFNRLAEFDINPEHFVERHGLIVIVTIGESVVAVGIGASGLPLDLELIGVAVLGLALSACLWWTFFGGGEDERAEAAMRSASPADRARYAILGYGYCIGLALLGIVAVAAGLEAAIAHPFDALETDAAVFLAAGAATFLIADTAFRGLLRIQTGPWRAVAAVAVLATIPIGTEGSALPALAAIVAVYVGALALESAQRAEP